MLCHQRNRDVTTSHQNRLPLPLSFPPPALPTLRFIWVVPILLYRWTSMSEAFSRILFKDSPSDLKQHALSRHRWLPSRPWYQDGISRRNRAHWTVGYHQLWTRISSKPAHWLYISPAGMESKKCSDGLLDAPLVRLCLPVRLPLRSFLVTKITGDSILNPQSLSLGRPIKVSIIPIHRTQILQAHSIIEMQRSWRIEICSPFGIARKYSTILLVRLTRIC